MEYNQIKPLWDSLWNKTCEIRHETKTLRRSFKELQSKLWAHIGQK